MSEHPHTHCCFCGAYNADDPKGYAGERVCHACGNGGQGEADLPNMAYKSRPAPPSPSHKESCDVGNA